MPITTPTAAATTTDTTPSSSILSVLRIGPAGDQAILLKNVLKHYFDNENTEINNNNHNHNHNHLQTTNVTNGENSDGDKKDTDTSWIPMTSSSSTCMITLENKYFTSNVLLYQLGEDLPSNHFHHGDDENAINTHNSNNSTTTNKDNINSTFHIQQTKEDGIILVFDALQCNPDYNNGISFDELDHVLALIQKTNTTITTTTSTTATTTTDDDDDATILKLCVGISFHPWSVEEIRGTNHEEEYTKRILWCLDHGYEYIEIDISQQGQQQGHDDRDKEGFARLIEAIQGTVWSSAIMKKKQKNLQHQPQELHHEQLLQDTSYEPPTLTTTVMTSTSTNETVTTTTIPAPFTSPESHNNNNNENNLHDGDDHYLDESAVEEESKAFHQLEGLLQEAKRIRDISKLALSNKNNNSNDDESHASDEQRRQRAADAATLMYQLMGQMGLEDDSDGNDGEDTDTDDNDD